MLCVIITMVRRPGVEAYLPSSLFNSWILELQPGEMFQV